MSSEYPSSIFYKAGVSDETQTDTNQSMNKRINVSSRIYSNSLESDYQDLNTPTLHSRLIDIHRTMLNSDFIPDGTSDGEDSAEPSITHTGGYASASDSQDTDAVSTTRSSFNIPNNSSEISTSNFNSITTSEVATTPAKPSKHQKSSKLSKDKLNRMFFY
jgi:hypothetical protein